MVSQTPWEQLFIFSLYCSCVDYMKGSYAFSQIYFYDFSLTFPVVCYNDSLFYRDWTYKSNFQPKKYFKFKHFFLLLLFENELKVYSIICLI